MFSPKQIAALNFLILADQNGTPLSKLMTKFLIEKSEMLTKEVCVTLIEGRDGYTAEEIKEAARGVKRIENLSTILEAMGSELHFSIHYGDFDPARGDPMNCDGQFAGAEGVVSNPDPAMFKKDMPMRYTFWLSRESYSDRAELFVTSRDEIGKAKNGGSVSVRYF